ncbi:MAG TPA: Scr1 family TA system antitoxin-like transcriptional regulator [Actinoallomurus sp.]|jgi:transcriptional regulator with XRE-family HTH domain
MAARMTGRAFFGRRLRLARERQAPKMSRRTLGARLNLTDSAVAAWESGRNIPDPRTLESVERILGTGGLLQDIVECMVTGEKSQEYVGRWAHVESQATTLLWFEMRIVPGLLQTGGYARAILRDDQRVQRSPRPAEDPGQGGSARPRRPDRRKRPFTIEVCR